jgi:hypothetical protein
MTSELPAPLSISRERLLQIVLQEPLLAILSCKLSDTSSLLAFLSSLSNAIDKQNEMLLLRWLIQILMSFLGGTSSDTLSIDFALSEFHTFSSQIAKRLWEHISSSNPIDDKHAP